MQASGLTEIIPLICTSALWGQHPVLSSILNALEVHRCGGFSGRWLAGRNTLCLLMWQVTSTAETKDVPLTVESSGI